MNKYNLQLNTSGLTQQMQNAVRSTTAQVSLLLQGIDAARPQNLMLPGVFAHCAFGPQEQVDAEETRTKARSVVLGNGLRDLVESLHPLLDEARMCCAVGDLAPFQNIPVERWIKARTPPRKWTRSAGLPDKVRLLHETYGTHLKNELEPEILSINKARGCLVHGLGKVRRQDCNDDKTLVLRWRQMQMVADLGTPNEHVISSGNAVLEKGTRISVRQWHPAERRFPLGQPVSITAEEFSSISWTFIGFVQRLAVGAENHLRSKGLAFPSLP